jgi:predicted transposase YdaD
LDFLSAQPDAQELARINYISAMREAEARGEARGRAEGKAEGEARGRAEALLLLLLDTRGLAVSEEQRERIMSCRDAAQLEQWLRRALSARSVDELLG